MRSDILLSNHEKTMDEDGIRQVPGGTNREKGDPIMSRLTTMLRNRFRPLLFLPFVAAVMALLGGGMNLTYAGHHSSEKEGPKNSHEHYRIRDSRVDPKMSPKARARVQRDAAIKNRTDARLFIQGVMEGKQPASSSEGGAK
jgi:hypothetical protein